MARIHGFRVALEMFLIGAAGVALGTEEPGAQPPQSEAAAEPAEVLEGPPIESGFVVYQGRYLPPPYVVQQRGDEVYVNDRFVDVQRLAGMPEDHDRRRGPPGGWAARGGMRSGGRGVHSLRVERQLDDNGLLLVEDGLVVCLRELEAICLLDVLLSEKATEAKVRTLVDEVRLGLNEKQWASIVAGFEPTDELIRRTSPLLDMYRPIWMENRRSSQWLIRSALLRSKPVKYGITLAAMALAVIAVGTLLTSRPNQQGRWRDVDDARESKAMVVRNVVLLAALGGLDLFLTLAAQQAGGFLELNPLGSLLADQPLLLGGFKLLSLSAACLILVMLRRYRGAQVASWWLCLLCTMLTFRWVTYNSLFFT